jgi:hypothetical protein
MTRAASLSGQISRCSAELSALSDALASPGAVTDTNGEWTPREILLHLIGAVRELPDQVTAVVGGARELPAREQQGGAYIDDAAIATAPQALAVLLEQLRAVHAAVHELSDEELSLPVRVPVDGVERDVPIGLVVRHMVADHVDEHIAQLREAIGEAQTTASAGTERP